MPGRDQLERQIEETVPVLRPHFIQANPVGPLHQCLIIRQLVGRDEGILREEFMIGRQILEQLDHRCRHVAADPDKILGQANLVENRADIGIAGEAVELELLTDRRAEQQVLGHACIGVELLRIERLDQSVEIQFPETGTELCPGSEDALSGFVATGQIKGAAQPEGIDLVFKADHAQQVGEARIQAVFLDTNRLVVDPVGRNRVERVSGCFRGFALAGGIRIAFGVRVAVRNMTGAQQHILSDCAGEYESAWPDIADPPSRDGLRQARDVDPVHGDAAGCR